MQFKLAATGTLTECREKLNATLISLPAPETQEHKVIRMIAHCIVAGHLDPLHAAWDAARNEAAASRTPKAQGGLGGTAQDPAEPTTSFAVDCSITYGSPA